jgi:dolichol-phosphate mannosyltransferase
MPSGLTVIVPTYNERDNIVELVRAIFQNAPGCEVLVVDDNSPDGTAQVLEPLKKEYNLNVLVRKDRRGLTSAIIDGIGHASGDIICVIDADFSHPPEKIPEMLKKIQEGNEVVVGSRFVKGGSIENWPWRRRAISRGAKGLARGVTKIRDPMSGFFMARKDRIAPCLADINPLGYKILLEVLVRSGCTKVAEVPIAFKDREAGQSKMGFKIMFYYLMDLFNLYAFKFKIAHQYAKFVFVGGLGTLVNLAVLFLWTDIVQAKLTFSNINPMYIGVTLAFITAATHNYILNRVWTFRSRQKIIAVQYSQFILVSVIGYMLNILFFYIFWERWGTYYIFSQLLAIFLASLWNFAGSKILPFREE